MSKSPLDSKIESVYSVYPRKVGKRTALRAIQFALTRLHDGEFHDKPMTWEDAFAFLFAKTKQYADSPAGNRGEFTPHPSTFFNQSRYLDHEIEWYRVSKEEQRQIDMQREANIGVSDWRPQ
jgi:hypothetical protein